MCRVEWNVAEERPVLVPLDEIARSIGKDVRAVAFGFRRLGVAIKVIAAVVNIRVVVAVSGNVAEVFIETAIGGPAAFDESEVPFAEAPADVSGLGEIARQDLLRVRQRNLFELRIPCLPVSKAPRDGIQDGEPM